MHLCDPCIILQWYYIKLFIDMHDENIIQYVLYDNYDP